MAKKKTGLSVLIVVPNHSATCHEHVAFSRMELVNYTKEVLPQVTLRFGLTLPHNLAQGRWDLVKAASILGHDYVFFMDSDMRLPKDALATLLRMDVDISSGLGFTNDVDAPIPSMFRIVPEEERHDPTRPFQSLIFYFQAGNDVLFRADAVGMFCCLIKTSVFHKIAEDNGSILDWFNPFEQDGFQAPTGLPYTLGEDLAFCYRASQSGYKVHVRTGIKCDHLPRWPKPVNEEMYLKNFDPVKYGCVEVGGETNGTDAGEPADVPANEAG